MKRDQRGFTLMELMIVIVIIGVLAAIGVPAYKNYVTESKNNACAANKRTIETAAGMYWAATGEGLDGHDTLTDETDKLGEYLKNVKSLTCPWDKTKGYKVTITRDVSDELKATISVVCDNQSNHKTP
ncbi:MAG: prepilin-type N-terminal cleavage/methylation domain-containing protein [Firmicutes bacterium]|nr:prepilin-type N-terminal cleavage/methylation domain-containing protein [Bacillota bacterium]